jgi:toxin-antitoxin system PIN domain toxin
MSVALLDVNVLVALSDAYHRHHELAHQWFARNRALGWATTPMTVNGCVRVMTNHKYPTVVELVPLVCALQTLCSAADHRFWDDSVSLLDASLFRPEMITSHNQITDVYLLGLAVRNHGKFVTFDRSILLDAVIGAEPEHLEILGR